MKHSEFSLFSPIADMAENQQSKNYIRQNAMYPTYKNVESFPKELIKHHCIRG